MPALEERPAGTDAREHAVVDPSLAVLTRAGSRFGLEFLQRLAHAGRKPALLCVEYTPFRHRIRMARFLASKIGWRDAARYNVRFWWPLVVRRLTLGHLNPLPDYSGAAGRVVRVRDINEPRVCDALGDRQVTKIVLAQSGIVRQGILATGKRVLNAHPGALPWYRGVDVVRWALLEGGPLEVTLHCVDAGIDTGPTLARRPLTVSRLDTWSSIEARANDACIGLLVDAALHDELALGPATAQVAPIGLQRYLMPFAIARDLEARWPALLRNRLQQAGHETAARPSTS